MTGQEEEEGEEEEAPCDGRLDRLQAPILYHAYIPAYLIYILGYLHPYTLHRIGIGGKLLVLEGSFSLAYLGVVNVAGGCRLHQEFTKPLADNLRLGPFERTYDGRFLCILKQPSLKSCLRGMAARSCLR